MQARTRPYEAKAQLILFRRDGATTDVVAACNMGIGQRYIEV